jgi:hypothetical protein
MLDSDKYLIYNTSMKYERRNKNMTEINGLDERISELKILYQEAERLNLKDKTIELLVDINYLEELRKLRNKQELCEDAVSRASVFEIMGNLLSIPYDFDRNITEKDVSESMDKIRELPRVTPQEPKWIPVTERLPDKEPNKYWVCVDTGYQCECRWTNMNLFGRYETTDWHWNIMDIPQYTRVVAWKTLPKI